MKDLSLHILDIVQNSIRANAGRISVGLNIGDDNFLTLVVNDDGSGMNIEQAARVKDPFFSTRTTRKIGLGVPLLLQKAEQCGGSLSVSSAPGNGMEVRASFLTTHPDCPPMGDIPECAWMLMVSNPDKRLIFNFISASEEWDWDSLQIREALGEVPLSEKSVRASLLNWFQLDFSNFKGNIKT
jgi:hypothetical protein